jgi:hypothetical protein
MIPDEDLLHVLQYCDKDFTDDDLQKVCEAAKKGDLPSARMLAFLNGACDRFKVEKRQPLAEYIAGCRVDYAGRQAEKPGDRRKKTRDARAALHLTRPAGRPQLSPKQKLAAAIEVELKRRERGTHKPVAQAIGGVRQREMQAKAVDILTDLDGIYRMLQEQAGQFDGLVDDLAKIIEVDQEASMAGALPDFHTFVRRWIQSSLLAGSAAVNNDI